MRGFLKKVLAVATVLCLVLSCTALSLTASAAENLAIGVESMTVAAGETVELKVDITANPGITVLNIDVEYDTSVLTLVGCTDKALLSNGVIGTNYKNPFDLYWNGALLNENITATGTVAILKFKVNDGAANGTATTVKLVTEKNSALNKDLKSVGVTVTSGTVTVADKLANIMPADKANDLMYSIRLEDKEAASYVSAGIRFRGTLTLEQMDGANEIGFVAAPYNAVASDSNWYKFDDNGVLSNSIARSAVCYEVASGKDVVYAEDNNGKAYQLVLTNLSSLNGTLHNNLEIAAVMYVKTADGYTYYRIGSATYQQVYDAYVAAGIIG